jgi:hypothetical protein
MKKFALALLFTIVLLTNGFSQCGAPNNYCFDNVTITACTGVIYDDQGPTGAYSDNGYTMTICPDNPGDVIQLDFSAFSLQTSPNGNNSDYLSIFDGNSTAAATLGDYTGNSLQGLQVTGTINNVTGCLTLVFDPNGQANATSPGLEAVISCTTPCANPTSGFELSSPSVQPFPMELFLFVLVRKLQLQMMGRLQSLDLRLQNMFGTSMTALLTIQVALLQRIPLQSPANISLHFLLSTITVALV